MAAHDFGGEAATVTSALDGTDDAEALVDLFGDESHPLDDGSVGLRLEPHAHRRDRVRRRGRRLLP